MDKVKKYQSAIRQSLEQRPLQVNPDMQFEEYERELILDDVGGHYLLLGVGWQGSKRVHGISVHIDLKGEKIWIQQDYTERGIARDLVDLGVPKSDIVLAFHAPRRRQMMEEYAAA